MRNRDIQRLIQKTQLEENLRGEFEATLQERVTRYLEVKPHEIIPQTHFALVSTEISLLFRDVHCYGCIALSQAVGEALLRFMCQRNKFKASKKFEDNLVKLGKRGFLTSTLQSQFTQLWNRRDDYHHLNSMIEQDRRKLKNLAKRKALLLNDIEREVFGYSTKDGKLILKYPQYWDAKAPGQVEAYLRFE